MMDNTVGVGLRPVHYPYLLERPRTNVGWFEAVSENYMDTEGRPLSVLDSVRQGLSTGAAWGLPLHRSTAAAGRFHGARSF